MNVLTLELFLLLTLLVIFAFDLILSDKRILGVIAFIGTILTLFASFSFDSQGSFFNGIFINDAFALFFKRLILLGLILTILGSYNHVVKHFKNRVGEYYLLLLSSSLGMHLLVSARELLFLFVSFELMSIPLYVLAGYAKEKVESVEASLKLFLFGTFSSLILLLSFTFILGTQGTSRFIPIKNSTDPLIFLSMVLFLVGAGFKVAMVPFHMWVPDTYQGAPTPYVAFLSVIPKAAGFAVLFRVLYGIFPNFLPYWSFYLTLLAGITMLVGNLLALHQTDLKRLLAYSGIAHIGYMLLGLAAASSQGVAMVLFYLLAYLFSNMGAFLVVENVGQNTGSNTLTSVRGLAKSSPGIALAMLVFLLSLGGIPFGVGFWAKLYVFLAAAKSGLLGLVLLGAILTVVALFYYLNVARKMYIEEVEIPKLVVPVSLKLAVVIAALAVVILGMYPKLITSPALEVANSFLKLS